MKKKLFLFLITTTMIVTTTACASKTYSASEDMLVFAEPANEAAEQEDTSPASTETEPEPATAAASAYTDNHTITVNSSEQINIVPDIAQIVYAVTTQKTSAADCQTENAASVEQVTKLLKELGVKEASIQTSDYYMHPVYNYSGNTARITGYEATTSLTVSDLPIQELDAILAGSVSSGINTVQSITYMASGYDQSYQEALTLAVNTAHQKAEILAAATDATIGKVISLQETSGYSEARYTDHARSNLANSLEYAKEQALADTAASIEPGEISVEASVIIEYQLLHP